MGEGLSGWRHSNKLGATSAPRPMDAPLIEFQIGNHLGRLIEFPERPNIYQRGRPPFLGTINHRRPVISCD